MQDRNVGYGLLILGILIMLLSVWQVFAVFTGKQEPYPVFQLGEVSIDLMSLFGDQPGVAVPTATDTTVELFSASDLSKLINMSTHFFLMSFVMLLGFRISSLGIMLLRPVVVKLKEAAPQKTA